MGASEKLTDEQLEKAFVGFKKAREEEHSRLRSWEHCFGQFASAFKSGKRDEETADYLSLHLGFYLASWGMMRNSDLMGYDYKIHIPLVKAILDFSDLRGKNPADFCDEQNGAALLGRLEKLYERVKDHCAQFCHAKTYEASGTLMSKIILGTLGIVPAYDKHVSGVLNTYGIATGDFSMESFRKFARYFTTNHTETVGRMTAEMQEICPLYTRTKVIDGLLWYVGK